MRLFTVLFPTSDRKHSVLAPLVLTAGHALALCPPNGPPDIAVGLFLASLLLSMAAPAKRFVPEVVPFCESLLVSALPREMRSQRCGYLKTYKTQYHQ